MTLELLEGSEAIARAALAANCSFFSGYPMLPFTNLLENLSRLMPDAGGVCMNASSEVEAINMALGASAAGARSATGSCGQGIALMQEAVAEAALNQLPLVIFDMARGQQDYFQCTRGGGWGDYRTITLAPKDTMEAVEHTQLLFHLADQYRAPVILYADYLIADTTMSVDVSPRSYGALPPKDWALDPSRGGTGETRVIWTFDAGKAHRPGSKPNGYWPKVAAKFEALKEDEARHESYLIDDAEHVIVSFGTASPFVDYIVDELRADGIRIGSFRPITLWPFPERALATATKNCKSVLVFEVNAGQMIDDVRISVDDRSKISFIGGISVDYSGMRQGSLLEVAPMRERILQAIGEGCPA